MAVVTLQDQYFIAMDTVQALCTNCWMPAQGTHATNAGQEKKSTQIQQW